METMDKFETIGKRIEELVDYLGIGYTTFCKRCKISNPSLINAYLDGSMSPTHATLNKIMNRYPVNRHWFLLGVGEMWNEDYFESRFRTLAFKPKTPSEKIATLLEVFECSFPQLEKITGIKSTTLKGIRYGKIFDISDDNVNKLATRIKFIPRAWYL